MGLLRLEPWNLAITKLWAPVNMIFVAMIGTSFYSLALLGVRLSLYLLVGSGRH